MDAISDVAPALNPAYAGMVLLGMLVLLLFPATRGFDAWQKRRYYVIQAITLVAAVLGAKLAVLMGDALWPLQPFNHWHALLYSGRSIVGALLVGFLVSEMAKPLLRYPLPPNDRFAVVLPFSIGIGRLGCYFAGCCLGLPHEGPLALVYADGIARYPIALYEMAFHFTAGLVLLRLYRSRVLFGRLFALYLAGYGVFRLLTEELRVTEKAFAGLSAYQWFALLMIIAGSVALVARRGWTVSTWTGKGVAA